MSKILGFGNCQTNGIARCAAELLGLEAGSLAPRKAQRRTELLTAALERAEMVFASRGAAHDQARDCANAIGRPDLLVIPTPNIYFSGFHPDMILPSSAAGDRQDLPMVNANSAILLAAWREGLEPEAAISLFRHEVYEALGYYETFAMATDALVEECALTGLDILPRLASWCEPGAFVYVPNHPRIDVLRDLASKLLQGHRLHDGVSPRALAGDPLAWQLVWPVYPGIADRLGVPGDTIFRPKRRGNGAPDDARPMDLETFVERTYQCYRRQAPDLSMFDRLSDPRLQGIGRFVSRPSGNGSANPYKRFGDSHWWSKAVAEPPGHAVDPVVRTKFKVGKLDRVATAGSCFAQHLAKRLAKSGFNYFVTEQAPPGCSDPEAEDYGVFTARCGNIYTVRQLLQLAERAYGDFDPAIDAWQIGEGFVDPFRPRIGGRPFSSLEELRESREAHFAAVREMSELADVFVFTLGLTEAWVSRGDGAVVPLAPGVIGADQYAGDYAAKNFSVAETIGDLEALLRLLRGKNPLVRIILTVSPVPLIATFEAKHVLEATTHSKSVLRAAAGEIADANADVDYFPSYEIVTGSFNRGRYFADDLRQVTEAGVDHVMNVFLRHYAVARSPDVRVEKAAGSPRFRSETEAGMAIVCDEEEIEGSVAGGAYVR